MAPTGILRNRDGLVVIVPAHCRDISSLERHLQGHADEVVRVMRLATRKQALSAVGTPLHPELAVTTPTASPRYATLGVYVETPDGQHVLTVRHLDLDAHAVHQGAPLAWHDRQGAPRWASTVEIASVDVATYTGGPSISGRRLRVVAEAHLRSMADVSGSRVKIRGARSGHRQAVLWGWAPGIAAPYHFVWKKGDGPEQTYPLTTECTVITLRQDDHMRPPAAHGDSGALVVVPLAAEPGSRLPSQDAAAAMVVAVLGEVETNGPHPVHLAYAVPIRSVLDALGFHAVDEVFAFEPLPPSPP